MASGLRGRLGRLGGEEFGLLLPDTDIAGAATVADKLRRRLSAPTAGHRALTVSFGVAEVHAELERGTRRCSTPTRALYAAERAGRGRVTALRRDRLGRGRGLAGFAL